MTCGLPKAKNYCKGHLFKYEFINQGVKHWVLLGKYRFKVVKVNYCKIKLRQHSKTFKKGTRNYECLNIANTVNTNLETLVFTSFERSKHPTFP